MVNLIYNGVMATGRYKSKEFEGVVIKGQTYDIPKGSVDEFIKSGDWKKPETKEIPVKKVKKVIKTEEVSDSEDTKSNITSTSNVQGGQ